MYGKKKIFYGYMNDKLMSSITMDLIDGNDMDVMTQKYRNPMAYVCSDGSSEERTQLLGKRQHACIIMTKFVYILQML